MSRFTTPLPTLRIGALLFLTLLGCAPPTPSGRPPRAHLSPQEISRKEIDAERIRFTTAYDLVRTLRPGMLATRGISTQAQSLRVPRQARHGIRVYVDDLDFGGVESLTSISAESVLEVHALSALDATTRFGTGHAEGAIIVTTRSGRR